MEVAHWRDPDTGLSIKFGRDQPNGLIDNFNRFEMCIQHPLWRRWVLRLIDFPVGAHIIATDDQATYWPRGVAINLNFEIAGKRIHAEILALVMSSNVFCHKLFDKSLSRKIGLHASLAQSLPITRFTICPPVFRARNRLSKSSAPIQGIDDLYDLLMTQPWCSDHEFTT